MKYANKTLFAALLAILVAGVVNATITNPLEKPVTGETGTWWGKLEDAIDRINEHVHDGTDSERVQMGNVNRSEFNVHLDEAISGVGWDFDLSGYASLDARSATLRLLDADNDYEDITAGVKIWAPGSATVSIQTSTNLNTNARLIVRGE